MPPVQQVWDFPGLPADIFFDHPKSSFSSSTSDSPSSSPSISPDDYLIKRTPEDVDKTLTARSNSKTYVPGKGTVDPHSINMQGLLALFALLGAAFVFGGIWFFFWAKNGGFVWRKGDWDDYKSTVLRRKGPDGRTLSNATKSTKLGGGSVVGKGYSDYDGDEDGYTESGAGYAYTATNLTEKDKEKERKKEEKKNKPSWKEIAKRRFFRRRADEHSWNGEEYEDDDVRAYRQEKSARVDGVNREAEGTYHGSDYDTSAPPTHYNRSEMSEARDYAYQPPSPPPMQETRNSRHQSKRQSKRESRNFSFTPGPDEALSSVAPPPRDTNNTRTRHSQSQHQPHSHSHTQEASARRHNRRRERRRNPPPSSSSSSSATRPHHTHDRRRERSLPPDYSSAGTHSDLYSNAYTNTNSNSNSQSSSNLYSEDESGTRSYHHPIPGLSKGYRRDGGRRRRRDSLSDSD